jgi:exodeoxyribonuclease VIII
VIRSCTFDEYRALPGVNLSTLKEMGRSPAHYQHRLSHARADSAAFLLGRATHTAVLEPDRFPLEYLVWDGGLRRGKKWENFRDANRGRSILTAGEYELCLALRNAVAANPYAREHLATGDAEQAITWTDPATGIECKARVDWLGAKSRLDLKTAKSAEPDAFGRAAHTYAYPMQAAFITDGCEANGLGDDPFAFLAVEKEPPHVVQVYTVGPDAMDVGRAGYQRLLEKLADCRQRDHWPGYVDGESELMLPRWAFEDDGDIDDCGLTTGGEAL